MANLPKPSAPMVDTNGRPAREWYSAFIRLLDETPGPVNNLQSVVKNILTRIEELEKSGHLNFTINGLDSVMVDGAPSSGYVQIALVGDDSSVPTNAAYMTNGAGSRGWHLIVDVINVTGDLTKTVDANNSVTVGLADLADSGVGAQLLKITRDVKGRLSGTSPATTDDLAEGSAQYFTQQRARDSFAFQNSGDVPVTLDGGVVKAALSADRIKQIDGAQQRDQYTLTEASSDEDAATKNVPVNGLYHTAGTVKIRVK